MSKPTFVYKIVHFSSPPPDPLPKSLPLSDLDKSSGFIHLSTAPQILGTLKHFFAQDPKVYILKIPYGPIEKDIKWEDPNGEVCGDRSGEGMFAHLYNDGLRLGSEEVESVQLWEKTEDGWDGVLKQAESWLTF